MSRRISVINYNGGATIGTCLAAVYSSTHESFEVIVVDDCSTDNSVEITQTFPVKLIRLQRHSGASRARNTGAGHSTGEVLFFLDADCIVATNTLFIADSAISREQNTVIGGTYEKISYDDTFFSTFQSMFVNYSETKRQEPDYIATHAMIIHADLFRKSGGFAENFLPILEDVEFSHRMRGAGYRLKMTPEILVRHIFNFNLCTSLRNAFRKSFYWTVYSIGKGDLLADSGTASVELKVNVMSFCLNLICIVLFFFSGKSFFLIPAIVSFMFNLLINRRLLISFYRPKGFAFAVLATVYYTVVYPFPVGMGAASGMIKFLLDHTFFKKRAVSRV
jgi:glycosyltransferase involved in cell wall biosynthesis